MERKERIAKAINEKLGVNYSTKRYKDLSDLGIVKITPINNDSMEDMAKVYKTRLTNQDIIENMDNFMNYSVSEFLVRLGRMRCSNAYEVDSAIFEILEPGVFNEARIENHAGYSDEPACLYLEDSNLKLGEDLVSYHRCSRCFAPSKRDASLEEELSNIATILNIGEDRLSCSKQDSYYSILLDGNQIGIWSLDLMDDFYEESEDIYKSEHHSKDVCEECMSGEYCKYQDDSLDLSKNLISDELNAPIFSISSLLEAINREVIDK